MKKVSTIIFAILFCTQAIAQKYILTPEGLRNKDDSSRTFIVLQAEGFTAEQLHNNAMYYAYNVFYSPEDVIAVNEEGEYLAFVTNDPDVVLRKRNGLKISATIIYGITLTFRDGRVKYEVSSFSIRTNGDNQKNVVIQGSPFEDHVIFKTNGKLHNEYAKKDIENYFNLNAMFLQMVLKAEYTFPSDPEDDW